MNRIPSGGLPQIQIPEEKKKARRGYQPMPAIDPSDGKFWEVLVSDEKIDFTSARGMGAAKLLAYCVPKVLVSPKCMFRGVREYAEDNWLCYVGCPSHDYTANGTGEIIGSLIKNIKQFISKVLERAPGFKIEIQGKKVQLEHIFTAKMWLNHQEPNGWETKSYKTYKRLRKVSRKSKLSAQFEESLV